MTIGEPCWRDANGTAVMTLPWRIAMPDGSTRTDPSQWSLDPAALAASGYTASTVTQADIDAVTPLPPPPDPLADGFETPGGWRLAWRPEDVALLTGLYVLSSRAAQLGMTQPIVVRDMAGELHTLTLAEFEGIMLAYGAARAALVAGDA